MRFSPDFRYGPDSPEVLASIEASPLEWRRPARLGFAPAGGWTLFGPNGAAHVEDACQGQLGDCWLLSVISMVAERPGVMERVFLTRELQETGMLQFRLCVSGIWSVVTIDDALPCFAMNGQLCYSQSPNGRLWVPYLEKAIAKVCKSYRALTSGRSVEAFSLLTGAPVQDFPLDVEGRPSLLDEDELWATLLSAYDLRFLIAASCGRPSGPSQSDYKAVGLSASHGYSVLQVMTASNGVRLMQLRNPHAQGEWNGDWSDHSHLWTPALRAEVGAMSEADDGVFWIALEDVRRFFSSLTVCKVSDVNLEFRAPVALGQLGPTMLGASHYAAVAVSQPTFVSVTLVRPIKRHVALNSVEDNSDVQISGVLVTKSLAGGAVVQTWLAQPSMLESHDSLEVLLDDSDAIYRFVPFGVWSAASPPCSLVLHAARPLAVALYDHSEMHLLRGLHEHIMAYGRMTQVGNDAFVYYLCATALILVLALNSSPSHSVVFGVDLSKSEGQISLGRGGLLTVTDTLPASHRAIVLALRPSNRRGGGRFSMSLSGCAVPSATGLKRLPALDMDGDVFACLAHHHG